MAGYAVNYITSLHKCSMLMIFRMAEAKKKKKRKNTANIILKTVTVNKGFQMSPITHGYTNNHLFQLKYILQETTNALYTYCIM